MTTGGCVSCVDGGWDGRGLCLRLLVAACFLFFFLPSSPLFPPQPCSFLPSCLRIYLGKRASKAETVASGQCPFSPSETTTSAQAINELRTKHQRTTKASVRRRPSSSSSSSSLCPSLRSFDRLHSLPFFSSCYLTTTNNVHRRRAVVVGEEEEGGKTG